MNTAVINIKVHPGLKKEAVKLASDFGLTLSALINVLLKKAIRTRTVTLSAIEEPSPYLIKALRESNEDIKKGRVVSFGSEEEAVGYLDRLIKNERKNSKN